MGLAMKDGSCPGPEGMGGGTPQLTPRALPRLWRGPGGGPHGKDPFAADERKQTEVDWKILKNQGVTEEDLKKYGGMEDDTDGE
ncbi:MAG: hypothetical protein ACLTYN_17705 [Dysosmobacter welbionis]